jgi:hypothetical protein
LHSGEVTRISVCTLFEKDYHYGLGALVNSLYANGYRGVVWAGYRGPLPPWAAKAEKKEKWTQLEVAEGLAINFVRLSTDAHFTNHKPAWMLSVFSDLDTQCDALYYFDPDITVNSGWDFFREWIKGGIALCQDINSHMPEDHPIRKTWEHFAEAHNLKITNRLGCYFNAGFIGAKRQYIRSLEIWRELMRLVAMEIGMDARLIHHLDHPLQFRYIDQDTLNIMAMVTEDPLSTVGPEGMGFNPGNFIMAHALRSPKPWNKNMISNILWGKPLRAADKEFFKYTQYPIILYPKSELFLKKLNLKIASALNRAIGRR